MANPSIVLREEFDDWAILFDPDRGRGYGLNPVGVRIWKLLDGKRSIAEIAAAIQAAFEDSPPELETEVKEFVEGLISKGLAGTPEDK